MLNISNLSVHYTDGFGEVCALDGISLILNKGESMGIIGESGSGKTSIGLAIMGLVAGRVSGKVVFNGENLIELSEEHKRRIRWNIISMVMQNTGSVLNPAYTVEQQIMEPMIEHGLDSTSGARQKASILLEKVHLAQEKSHAFPHELSGGETQRVLIAMALANDPQLIILDEPTSSLDALTRSQIIRILTQVKNDCSLIVISHDANTLSNFEHLMVLYAGKVMECGPTELLLTNPRHPYTKALMRSHPFMETTKDLQAIRGQMPSLYNIPEGCRFHTRCVQKIDVCEREVPELKTYGNRKFACHRGGIHTLLEVRDLKMQYRSKKCDSPVTVLKGVSLQVQVGEIVALVGQTGCGKSTLAKLITRIIQPASGKIFLDDREIHTIDPKKFHKDVQMIFQNTLDAVNPRFKVYQIVKEPLDIQGHLNEQEMMQKIKHTLSEVSIPIEDEFLNKYPHQLSGGELQRVTIARALVNNPRLLIADEPTAFLDVSVQAKILKLLMRLQNTRGMSMLLITHDIALARKVSDRIAVMHDGNLIEEGTSSEVIHFPKHPYTKLLLGYVDT